MLRPVFKWMAGLAALLALAITAAPARAGDPAPVAVDARFSALWYPTGRSGEGWTLEILDADTALLYWFTYDEDGGQRWMTALGDIQGDRIDFPELVVTSGGRFGPAFDPDEVVREVVGDAVMSFQDCDRGTFDYRAFGQAQTLPIERLTTTWQLECAPPGDPAAPDYGGQSASWYDPTHSGEGYTLQWLTPGEVAVVTWFSYDGDGRQYWMLGTGRRYDGAIVFADMHATRGARFGSGFDEDDVERFAWGELSLGIDCDAGTAQYQSPLPAFGTGTLNLVRLTRLHDLDCAIAPAPDPAAATWSVRAQTGPALSELPTAALGDSIYVAGGLTSQFANSRQFWRYQPATNQWSQLPDLPGPRDHATMVALDGRLYFLGGFSQAIQSPSAEAWRFDPAAGQWAAIAPMPRARAAGGAAVVDGRIYVTGGTSHLVDAYDPAANAWQTFAIDDPAHRDHSAAVAYRGEVWILGGRDHGSGVPHGAVTIFNPRTGRARPGPAMGPRSGFAAAVVGDRIVVAGGEGLSPPYLITSAIAYSPASGAWSVIAAPPIAVHGAGAVGFEGDVYLMLGSTLAGGASNPGRVQVLDMPDP